MGSEQHTVERLFAERPSALRLFHRLAPRIEGLGDIRTVVTKSQVSYGADRKFAWLWPPARSKSSVQDLLMLTLDTRGPLSDPLIVSVEETYPGKWTHQIKVTDDAVIERIVSAGWLDAALDFGIKPPK
ncbi:DUF5655 domain-containing protein [Nocardia sp. NPDC050712]|uniref:DUF5655 domain-containing protein n=1 Tax=Nocardia sp. NPDC050712 TaxID=3155518 RepID=UPI0033E71406